MTQTFASATADCDGNVTITVWSDSTTEMGMVHEVWGAVHAGGFYHEDGSHSFIGGFPPGGSVAYVFDNVPPGPAGFGVNVRFDPSGKWSTATAMVNVPEACPTTTTEQATTTTTVVPTTVQEATTTTTVITPTTTGPTVPGYRPTTTVTVTDTTTATSRVPSTLPNTGAGDAGSMALGGVGLVLVGALLVAAGRRMATRR
jgi:LPXTG-motif cell wall-anchored protein